MPLEPVLSSLTEFSIFGGIRPEHLAEVGDLFEAGSYPANTRIIEQGTQDTRLYIVTSGQVQVTVRCQPGTPNEFESVLSTLGRGATIGEMEMLDTQERSASVTAVEDTETVELTSMGLYQIFRRKPDVFRMIILNLARDLSRRLRAANQRLARTQTNQETTA